MKIAVLGASGHWNLLKEALAARAPELQGCEVHAAPGVPGEDVTPVLTAARALGAPATAHPDWRALLDYAMPEFAIVNPPFHLIGALTRECLARGIHVLAEKPIATEWDDLRAIASLAGVPLSQGGGPAAGAKSPAAGARGAQGRTASGAGPGDIVAGGALQLATPPEGSQSRAASRSQGGRAGSSGGPKLMSTFTMRYDAPFLAAQRYVAQGGIGKPSYIHVQKSYPLESWDGGPRPAFYRKRKTFGGVIPWIGMHAIDLIRWFGESEFTTVSAAQTRLGNQGHDELEAAATLHFTLASGAIGAAQVDFLRRRTAKPEGGAGPGEADAWGDDRLRAAGDGGMLEVRAGKAWAVTKDGKHVDVAPVTPPLLLPDFIRWAQGGAPMLLSTADCLAAADATLKARDAADRGAVLSF